MNQTSGPIIELPTQDNVDFSVFTYPINRQEQIRLIDLLQNEWQRTNVDWIESMSGQHADHLVRHAIVASVGDLAVATASVAYPVKSPEVCVIEDVMSLPAYRGLGIARRLTTMVVDLAFGAGCRVAYLGNAPTSRPSVYLKCGFVRTHGAVMRCAASGEENCEQEFFSPGQSTSLRPSQWGDMPGVACLMDQEMQNLLADFRQGLVSPKYMAPTRCVSNFTSIWYDAKTHGGAMCSLIGETAYRVLGFGSLIPGAAPGMSHSGTIDVAVHDHYEGSAPGLIAELERKARERSLKTLNAYIATVDTGKINWLKEAGFTQVGVLPGNVLLNDDEIDVAIFEKKLTESDK